MSKAIVTILGLIGHTKFLKGVEVDKEISDFARYYYDTTLSETLPPLQKTHYINMLPLILENFDGYEKVCIYTQTSLSKQTELLEHYGIGFDIKKNGFFVSEKAKEKEAAFSYILNGINQKIDEYDSVILDLTHGHRHIPILSIINLIMQNIQHPQKIEYILFAKEIKWQKEYEIIDLRDYLELANLSYMLSTFRQNYTVSSSFAFKNTDYGQLAEQLNVFSSHFLSNSLKPLIEGDTIVSLIASLTQLGKETEIKHFSTYVDEIIQHLHSIKTLKNQTEWKMFYALSKIMAERGYLLNAITLLFEAIGFYCAVRIEEFSIGLSEHISSFKKFIEEEKRPAFMYSTYTLTSQSRRIIKLGRIYYNDFLFNPETVEWSSRKIKKAKDNHQIPEAKSREIKSSIFHKLDVLNIEGFQKYIGSMDRLRNNMAHGNSSTIVLNIKAEYEKRLKEFETFCIKEDVLSFKTKK